MTRLYIKFQKKSDPEDFYSTFRSLVVDKSEMFFPHLEFSLRGVITTQLCDGLFIWMKTKHRAPSVENNARPISKEELDGLQNLAGYVVKNLIKKNKSKKKEYNKHES